jgi:hypothetical protein
MMQTPDLRTPGPRGQVTLGGHFYFNQGGHFYFNATSGVIAALAHVLRMRHPSPMAKMIQVRNVPDRLHRELVRRARLRGQTLTDYIQEILDGARGPGPGLGAGRR